MKYSIFLVLSLSILLLLSGIVNAISIINTPSGNQTISGHTVSINSTIDSVNPLDTVSINLSGVVTNIKDPSLILCYNFDNRSALGENDTYVYDDCGGNNGTVVGGENVSMTSNGKYNGAVNFSGNNAVVSVPNNLMLNFTIGSSYTVSAWFKDSYTGFASTQVIVEKWAQGNLGYAFAFRVSNDSSRGKLSFLTYNGSTGTGTTSDIYVNDSQWHHFVGVNNGTAIFLYVDGELHDSRNLVENGVGSYGSNSIGIGARSISSSPMNGSVDEVRIWNRSLTANEASYLYYMSLNKFNSTRYNLYGGSGLINAVSNQYSIIINDTLSNNAVSSLQNIYRRQNIVLTTTNFGNINSYFYGANVHSSNYLLESIGYQSASDGAWLQNAWLNSKMTIIRMDSSLGTFYSNTTDVSGVNFTDYPSQNLSYVRMRLILWAQANNVKVLVNLAYMPTWLADNSSGMCTDLKYCPPINATKYANIFLDWYYRVGCTPSTCEVEVWNEPYHDNFFMAGLGYDNINKALNYTKMYDTVYTVIKANNSLIQVGGPAGYRGAPNMTRTFLTNETGKWDFLSIHPYGYTRINGLEQYDDTRDLYALCDSLGISCGDNMYLNEWNVGTSALQNLTYGSNEYGQSFAQSYISLLNNYPSNISNMVYQWTQTSKYNSSQSEYPFKWQMVSSPSYDNEYNPSYNITYLFTRYAPSGGTVYNSTNDYTDGILQVYTKSSDGKTTNLIITNTENDIQNITLSCGTFTGNLIDVSSGELYSCASGSVNLGVTDEYEVRYLTEPVITYDGTYATYSNYLGEFLTRVPSVYAEPEERQLVMCSTLSGTINSFANMVVWFILAGAIFVIFHVIKNNGNINPDKLNIPDVPEGFKIPVGLIIFGIIFVAVLVLLITTVVCSI